MQHFAVGVEIARQLTEKRVAEASIGRLVRETRAIESEWSHEARPRRRSFWRMAATN